VSGSVPGLIKAARPAIPREETGKSERGLAAATPVCTALFAGLRSAGSCRTLKKLSLFDLDQSV